MKKVEAKRGVEFCHSTRKHTRQNSAESGEPNVLMSYPAVCGIQREAEKKSRDKELLDLQRNIK